MTPEDEQRLKDDIDLMHIEIARLETNVKALAFQVVDEGNTLLERILRLEQAYTTVPDVRLLIARMNDIEEQRAKDAKYYSKVIIAQQSAIDELQCAMREKKKKGKS